MPLPARTLPTFVFFCLAIFAALVLFSIVPPRSADAPACGKDCPLTLHGVVPRIPFATPPPASKSPLSPTVQHLRIPCTKQCANGSKCLNDVCICDENHYGRRCQTHYGLGRRARDQEHTNSKLYFTSATAQSRQQLATMNLFHCPSIIEVGGLFAGTLDHLNRIGWTGNFTQMDMFGPQDANVTRTTVANGEVRVRRVVRSRQLCGENPREEAAHACFVFIGIPMYGGMGACAAGVAAAGYQTIILESPFPRMFNFFAAKLFNSTQYKSWGIAADWSEDLRRNGVNRTFPARRFRVFNRRPRTSAPKSDEDE